MCRRDVDIFTDHGGPAPVVGHAGKVELIGDKATVVSETIIDLRDKTGDLLIGICFSAAVAAGVSSGVSVEGRGELKGEDSGNPWLSKSARTKKFEIAGLGYASSFRVREVRTFIVSSLCSVSPEDRFVILRLGGGVFDFQHEAIFEWQDFS